MPNPMRYMPYHHAKHRANGEMKNRRINLLFRDSSYWALLTIAEKSETSMSETMERLIREEYDRIGG